MASAPLVDVLASEAAAIRDLHRDDLAEFLTEVDREGWEYARITLVRYRKPPEPEREMTIQEETEQWR
jgi:hypothetical protein